MSDTSLRLPLPIAAAVLAVLSFSTPALAADTITRGNTTTETATSANSVTDAHTVAAGNNTILFTAAWISPSPGATDPTATVNGQNATLVAKSDLGNGNYNLYIFCKVAPATGDVVVTSPSNRDFFVVNVDYSGAAQECPTGAAVDTSYSTSQTSNITLNVTTPEGYSWIFSAANAIDGGTINDGSNFVQRNASPTYQKAGDTNAPVQTAGSTSVTVNHSGTTRWQSAAVAFAPQPAGGGEPPPDESATNTIAALNDIVKRMEVLNAMIAYAVMVVFFASSLYIGFRLTRWRST